MMTGVCGWTAPPATLTLEQGEVHVWKASLDVPEACVRELERLLTYDEVVRADRLQVEMHRRRFVVGRGILRRILAAYTGIAPEAVRLVYGPQGKPALADECGGGWLQFNLAHAHELALYGVTCGNEIGVDVEQVCVGLADLQIAEHFFAPAEVAALGTVTGAAQVAAFFNCWTRKEAYIKARGIGLSLPLDEFEVSLLPGEPACLLRAEDHEDAAAWSLAAIDVEPSYVAALALAGTLTHLQCWEVPEEMGVRCNVSGADPFYR